VIERVGEDNVARLQNRAEKADVRGIARTEIKSCVRLRELRECGFELLPFGGVAGKKTRAGRAYRSCVCGRVGDSLLQARVGREAEVIVGAEIDAA